MMTEAEGLRRLAEAEGATTAELLEACAAGDHCPGICLFCGWTGECEPDARRNRCEQCTANNVRSALVLAGWI